MPVDDSRRGSSTHVFVEAGALDIDGVVVLDDETEHHLSRVLRLRTGEIVTLSDGAGKWRQATVVADANFKLEVTSEVMTVERSYPPLTLATAIPKGDRAEWLVQKAVELGVDTVQFLHTERSVVRWKPERADKQLVRLRRIALEAARQSRRVRLPELLGPVDASVVLARSTVAEPGGRAVAIGDSCLAVGPEGGWSPEELEMASDQVSLGPNVLRTETAALAATALYVAAHH